MRAVVKPASILVAATLVGPCIEAIAKVTGYSEQYVSEVAFRMCASRMWVEGTVSVAEGVIVRTQTIQDGKPVYTSEDYESVN